jgi:hypothetical protein
VAHDLLDLLFQVPHAGLAGVAVNHGAQPLVGDFQFAVQQAVLLALPRDEVAAGNGYFSSST